MKIVNETVLVSINLHRVLFPRQVINPGADIPKMLVVQEGKCRLHVVPNFCCGSCKPLKTTISFMKKAMLKA